MAEQEQKPVEATVAPTVVDTKDTKVEGTPETAPRAGNLPGWATKELRNLREDKRNSTVHLSQLEARLNQLQLAVDSRQEATVKTPSFYDDPEGFAQKLQTQIAKTVHEQLSNSLSELGKRGAVAGKMKEAESWLLTRDYVKQDPNAVDEIRDILNSDPEYLELEKVSPVKALKLAYTEWCESKGVSPLTIKTSAAKASGVPASASGVNFEGLNVADLHKQSQVLLSSFDARNPESAKQAAQIVEAAKKMLVGK